MCGPAAWLPSMFLPNDSDPDGDAIALVANGFEARPELRVEATDSSKVLLTAPSAAGHESIRYQIRDEKEASGGAVVRVRVSPTAELEPPVAKDDHVTPAETLGKSAVDVPVLKNDSDPDGVAEELESACLTATPMPGPPTATWWSPCRRRNS